MLPRKRRAPSHFNETASNTHYHETVESLYRKYYFEILDKLIGEIERRFESPTFTLYSKVEEVPQYAATGVDVPCADVKDIVGHFGEDLHDADLCTELAMLKNTMQGIEFSVTSLKEKLSVHEELFPQVSKAVQTSSNYASYIGNK